MPCFDPRPAVWEDEELRFVRTREEAAETAFLSEHFYEVLIPCKKCLGCRQAHARDDSIRAVLEAQSHRTQFFDHKEGINGQVDQSAMLTLTYDEKHLPSDGRLRHSDFQAFMKDLANWRRRDGLRQPRYLMCGEYGTKGRPHFHCLIFGEDFHHDRRDVSMPDGQLTQMSADLDSCWGRGFATIDPCNAGTATYVAGYVAKKAKEGLNPHGYTWEQRTRNRYGKAEKYSVLKPVAPEYRSASTKPGLGKAWYDLHKHEAYQEDLVYIDGHKLPLPKYFDKLYQQERPDNWELVVSERKEKAAERFHEWDDDRLAAACSLAHQSLSTRAESLE